MGLRNEAGLRGLFSVTLFLGAALLFWIQLMVSKLLLPLLGGSSAVWNTCLVFFQVALLLGYLYAHLTAGGRIGRFQPIVHPVLLVAAGLVLPVSVIGLGAPAAADNPIVWLLGSLLAMIGLPFTVLSGTAPTLQAWFSRTRSRFAGDPYFLYAASNLGSLTALLSYPTLVEPNLSLAQQSRYWTAGYALLAILTMVCAASLRRNAAAAEPAAACPPGEAPSLARRAHWLLLALAPSSLLLGVTSHLTTDVAAVPLFWVVPLVLYLLSYILAFQQTVTLPRRGVARLQAGLLAVLAACLLVDGQGQPIFMFGLHLLSFFATALFCHMELARLRPAAGRLTEFYLLMALGGALGGTFNALLAPVLFDQVVEYPLVLVLVCLLRPGLWPHRRGTPLANAADLALPAVVLVVLLAVKRVVPFDLSDVIDLKVVAVIAAAALAVAAFQRRPVRFALGVAALAVVGSTLADKDSMLLRVRNFYGQITVLAEPQPPAHVLLHGTTRHGTQSLLPAYRLVPVSYYHRDGPLGQVWAAMEPRRPLGRVGVVGLGTGTVACYGRPGEAWTYFEINPAVVAVAEQPRFFTYLRDCGAHPDIVLGDARLSLAREPDSSFDLIILDAFSSDSIPIHLITREAVALYQAKLRPGGVLVFDISNFYLDLAPVLGDIAADLKLSARLDTDDGDDTAGDDDPRPDPRDASDWAVLTNDPALLTRLDANPAWRPLPVSGRRRPWTDGYSNLLGAMVY